MILVVLFFFIVSLFFAIKKRGNNSRSTRFDEKKYILRDTDNINSHLNRKEYLAEDIEEYINGGKKKRGKKQRSSFFARLGRILVDIFASEAKRQFKEKKMDEKIRSQLEKYIREYNERMKEKKK